MALNLKHLTPAQFAAQFWERLMQKYQESQGSGRAARQAKTEYAEMLWWLYARIQAGDLNSLQIRNSFNLAYGRSMNTTQWNAFVAAKFVPVRDAYQALLDAGAL